MRAAAPADFPQMTSLRTDARLHPSPTFSVGLAFDGRAFVAQDVEPYAQYWLSPDERLLLSLFPARGGASPARVIAAHLRATGRADTPRSRNRLGRLIDDMRAAGVLIAAGDDVSRYDAGMAQAYLEHRPIPPAVISAILGASGAGADTRILDLAAGPGNLALPLAEISGRVAMMELSTGFVAAARAEAARRGLRLEAIQDSCNRLPSHDGTYDLITISQALHWLDDVAVCRGVCRLLDEGGSFAVVHAALELPQDHPLSFVLGDRTPLGDKAPEPFAIQADSLARRLSLLFEALDTPDVQRIDPYAAQVGRRPIRAAGVTRFRETRPIGLGFARAFLSERHIALTGLSPAAFWAEAEARCAAVPEARLLGWQDWAVLHFRRGGPGRVELGAAA